MNRVKKGLDNQAIGLLPLLLFMFLDNYFSYLLSFIIGVTFCFVCIFLFWLRLVCCVVFGCVWCFLGCWLVFLVWWVWLWLWLWVFLLLVVCWVVAERCLWYPRLLWSRYSDGSLAPCSLRIACGLVRLRPPSPVGWTGGSGYRSPRLDCSLLSLPN